MDTKSLAHSAHDPRPDLNARESCSCEVCGRTSHEATLIGLSGDRSWSGPFFCLEDHPRFAGAAITGHILNFSVAGMGL